MRCNRCKRPMEGTTANDGACECGGLIEATPPKSKYAAKVERRKLDSEDEEQRLKAWAAKGGGPA